ncbi:DUF397 domain-containing protein [Streptomyces zhihengii]|uniref:DUF397 domain-containing protein n=1 Tax=Streptomyces zhihengii TaxID=1818004 RepID=A0ABS2USJ7_9ACTN|nr:DUF397 domain-containing protein [Streptomyces zhihengii]MBM9619680.1 DUF397 domain-containing protein [Streptomyces zhihengii]
MEPAWFKSSYSSGEPGSDCVEVAATPSVVHVRDSKDTSRPALTLGRGAWAEFVAGAGE